MTITELIAQLEAIKAEHGDLVAVMHDREWGEYWTVGVAKACAVRKRGPGTFQPLTAHKASYERVALIDCADGL